MEQNEMSIYVKSTTGKIHVGSQSGTYCSSGNRGMRVRPASIDDVKNAVDSTFCGKCFVDKYYIDKARKGVCPQ